MKRMRKCNEIYQLAKDQTLVKKLKNKRFRPFCLCPPDVFKDIKERVFGSASYNITVMFVTHGSKNFLFFVFDSKENQRNKRESF